MSRKQRIVPVRPPSQRQISRWRREQQLQRAALILAAVVLALVVAIPAYGYYREVIARGREPIARVDDRVFTVDDYVKRMVYQDLQYDAIQQTLQQQIASTNASNSSASQQLQQLELARASLSVQVIEDLINDEVIARRAPALGITVTEDEVSTAIRERLLGAPKTDKPASSAQQADLTQRQQALLNQTGLTEPEYRSLIRADLLRQKLDQYLRHQVPTTTEQVHVAAILVSQKDEAERVRDRLIKGEDFGAVAKEQSTDTASKDKGGDLGWLPRGIEPAAFDAVAFSLPIGQISEPVETDLGYYILKVLGKETRPIDADRLEQLQGQALEKWLDEQKKQFRIERYLNSDKQMWATERVTKAREKRQQTN